MPSTHQPPLPTEVSLLRIVAQGLVPATSAATPVEAVHALLAVQGQQVGSIPDAISLRTAGARRHDVHAAFDAGELVRSWPMRGTVHVTTTADHHWLREVLHHRMRSWAQVSLQATGLTPDVLEEAGDTALRLIAEEGPLPRARLMEVWADQGLLDPGLGEDVVRLRRRHLLIHLHRDGILVQGPLGRGEHLLLDASDLPPASTGIGGSEGVRHGQPGHRAAMAEVARRFATGHGPVAVADLARWSGVGAREARQALEDAVEVSADRGVPLVRRGVRRGRRGALVEGPRPEGETLYLRADLEDLLAASRRRARATFWLPSFDELHVGYRDRSCLTDERGERLICPAANGMFRPLLVDAGRLVAVDPLAAGMQWLAGEPPSARVEHDVERARARMAGLRD